MAKKNSDFYGEINVELEEIIFEKIESVYPGLKNHMHIESNLEYLLDSAQNISANYLRGFIKLHPLVLVQDKGRYYCVSNIRLFRIAKIVLEPKSFIHCFILKAEENELIEKIATTDFYLSHLLFSLRPVDCDDQICRAWQALDDVKKQILPEAKQLSALTKLLNVSRKKAYLKRKKQTNPESNAS